MLHVVAHKRLHANRTSSNVLERSNPPARFHSYSVVADDRDVNEDGVTTVAILKERSKAMSSAQMLAEARGVLTDATKRQNFIRKV